MSVGSARVPGDRNMISPEMLANAGNDIDEHLSTDRRYPELADQIGVLSHENIGLSGVNDFDYPSLSNVSDGLSSVHLISPVKHVPLPSELVEQFSNMQCNCQMGLFPEIRRAWLSIDSDIFVWKYDDGSDLAYFDGLSETILSAGLVKPKPDIFQEHIKFLLCLTTPVDVVLLGVSFTDANTDTAAEEEFAEMHLLPEPLFSLQTDNVYLSGVTGTLNGRIFLCGRDGCVYEMDYQGAGNWFGKKCKKLNHSASSLSFLVPSFLSFGGEDPVVQLAVDNTRNILYCRTEKSCIQIFDLGADGMKTSYVACCREENIVNKASNMLRNVDRSRLTPIVHIAPIPTDESQIVHLVAITQSGTRLYFTTTTIDRCEDRPSKLYLVHVRMPPGCAPSARPERPVMVHAAYYRQGISLLCSSPDDDNDVLWSISPDIFPFPKNLQESFVTNRLDGRAWALHEVPESGYTILPSPVPNKWPDPPAIITQHAQPPRTFVILSAQGSYLFTTIRPFEQLKQLLVDNNGSDAEAVQAFFRLLQVDHACATALVLACSSTDHEVVDWATQAFFKYGSATVSHPTLPNIQTPYQHRSQGQDGVVSPNISYIPPTPAVGGSHEGSYLATPAVRSGQIGSGQNPPLQSTPYPGAPGAGVVQPEITRSGKLSGLCLYLARILGPLWDNRLVAEDYHMLPEPPNNWIYSRMTSNQIGWFVEKLQNVEKWLEANMTYFAGSRSPLGAHISSLACSNTMQTTQPGLSQGTFITESRSVMAISHLIKRCREVLSLWHILEGNQFHLVAERLSQESRDRLKFLKFRDFAVSGNAECSQLIASLMTCFLDDNTSTDTISDQLRNLCPTLYTTDDAVCTKANELLDAAKKAADKYERERTLQEASRLYRQVANQIDLSYICSQFQELRFYEGIVELAVHTAETRDSQNLALHYYENGEPGNNAAVQGYDAFMTRQRCYKCVLDSLTYLLTVRQSRVNSTNIPNRPGPPSPSDPNTLTAEDAERLMEVTLVTALRCRDECFLASIFNWLIDKNLTERLLEVRSVFLETYLKRLASIKHPNNIALLDLLWKYYEKTQDYSAAARILNKLAEREGSDIDLDGRLEYLSRAIMSAKGCNVRLSSISDGEFLHELEEKLEVARLQLQVYEQLVQLKDTERYSDINEALDQLNSKLMDVTKLYGDFADRFQLPECKLAIIHCAGHFDTVLVEDLWENIVDTELYRTRHSSQSDRMTALRYKLVILGRTYVHSERYFPLSFMVRVLEENCCRLGWDPTWVFETMLEISILLPSLHRIYDRLFKTKDQVWQTLNRPFYILEVLFSLILKFVELPTLVSPQERPTFTAAVYDACATYLVELQSSSTRHPACEELIGMFKGLQSRLKRAL